MTPSLSQILNTGGTQKETIYPELITSLHLRCHYQGLSHCHVPWMVIVTPKRSPYKLGLHMTQGLPIPLVKARLLYWAQGFPMTWPHHHLWPALHHPLPGWLSPSCKAVLPFPEPAGCSPALGVCTGLPSAWNPPPAESHVTNLLPASGLQAEVILPGGLTFHHFGLPSTAAFPDLPIWCQVPFSFQRTSHLGHNLQIYCFIHRFSPGRR